MQMQLNKDYSVQSSKDGRVWVNGRFSLIGRFGPNGIDIHMEETGRCESQHCLYCTRGPTSEANYDMFVSKMNEHHGIDIDPKHKPKKFKKEVQHASQ